MYNRVILVGRLTRAVELKYLPSGTSIASFGLATSRNWKDKNSGEDKEETMFIDVNIFGRSGEIANQYLNKGNRVLVEGRLVLDQWSDEQGNKRSRHKIVADSLKFMETKSEANASRAGDSDANYNNNNAYANSGQQTSNTNATMNNNATIKEEKIPEIDIDDDDIPF